jgi:hypothetical protein
MRARKLHDHATGSVYGTTKTIRDTPCGKQGYTSRKVALERAAIARRETGEPIQAYKCTSCHLHHIGHPPGWRAQQQSEAS